MSKLGEIGWADERTMPILKQWKPYITIPDREIRRGLDDDLGTQAQNSTDEIHGCYHAAHKETLHGKPVEPKNETVQNLPMVDETLSNGVDEEAMKHADGLPNWDSILEAANKSLPYPDGLPEQEPEHQLSLEEKIAESVVTALIEYHGETLEDFDEEEYIIIKDIVRPIIEKLVNERDSARILHAHDNTFSHAVKRAKEAEERAEQLQARVDDLERAVLEQVAQMMLKDNDEFDSNGWAMCERDWAERLRQMAKGGQG